MSTKKPASKTEPVFTPAALKFFRLMNEECHDRLAAILCLQGYFARKAGWPVARDSRLLTPRQRAAHDALRRECQREREKAGAR